MRLSQLAEALSGDGGGSGRRRVSRRPPRDPRDRQPRDRCRAGGCERATTERKPYCIDHLELMPYVANILKQLAERDAQDAAGWRTSNVNCIRAREIATLLALHGAQTEHGLASRLADITLKALRGYLMLLEEAGYAKRFTFKDRHNRRCKAASLTPEGRDWIQTWWTTAPS